MIQKYFTPRLLFAPKLLLHSCVEKVIEANSTKKTTQNNNKQKWALPSQDQQADLRHPHPLVPLLLHRTKNQQQQLQLQPSQLPLQHLNKLRHHKHLDCSKILYAFNFYFTNCHRPPLLLAVLSVHPFHVPCLARLVVPLHLKKPRRPNRTILATTWAAILWLV